MGARQSKGSMNVTTGKKVTVEGSEVAASGGEGKLERIEDVDTLKPQLNGTAEHQEDVVISDKEKQMKEQDEAPENEKDNCNEKEIILSPVAAVNGESEQKEGAESAETPESGKKQKKEKVKKKWSFRSISFSKKDKTKPTKKEETTNGECEKVPEEAAADAQVVSNETPEAKEETEATSETTKVEEAVEKPAEKTPETPATESITNGSSAPESPKEEVAQNGQVAEEQPAPVEVKEEVAVPAEAPKPVECSEVPAVEALPVNGLKIEETIEEVKEVAENKVDVSEKIITEPVEAKAPEAIETEVCVEKEKPEPVEAVEAPPPLPVNPPPSSLTIFAEKTMAPHLVDTQVVGEMPIVDITTSLSSDLPPPPVADVTDNSQQATIDKIAQPTSENEAIADAQVEESKPVEVINNEITPSEPIIPVVKEVEIAETVVESKIVENLAVVSSSEPEPVSPVESEPKDTVAPIETLPPVEPELKESIIPEVTESSVEIPKEQASAVEESKTDVENPDVKTESSIDDSVVQSEESAPIIIECSLPVMKVSVKNIDIPKSDDLVSEQTSEETLNLQITQCENIDIIPQISDDSISPPPPEPQSVPSESSQSEDLPKELPLELTQSANVEMSLSDIIPPPVNIPESPLPQRTPSDPDVSETGLTEQSDSFPAPPPPVSCPESITEISASESLPPPPSESSQADTVLNSPTSETSDFPPKDLPSPVKDEQHAESEDVKPEAVNSELPTAETQAPVPEETTPAKVAEPSVEEVPKVVSANASQVKDIAEITAVDMQTDSIPTQNCVVAAE